MRQIDPYEGSRSKQRNADTSFGDRGISVPTVDEYEQTKTFFSDWKHLFSSGLTDLGCTNVEEHSIELTDSTPFKELCRRIPPPHPRMFEEVREHLRDMLEASAMRKSHSPFSSYVVLVRMKGGPLRF